jgi:hypothetical protein
MPTKRSSRKGFAAGAAHPSYRDGSRAQGGPTEPGAPPEQQLAGLALQQIGELVAEGCLTETEGLAEASVALRAPGSAAAGGASPAAAGGGGGATAKRARAGGDADTGVEQAGQRCGYPQCGALLTDAQGTPVAGENQEL